MEGKKNDRKDDKTRWELIPLDCLEDIARVYTEGAKKYGDNTWQNLDNGYERYMVCIEIINRLFFSYFIRDFFWKFSRRTRIFIFIFTYPK